MPAQSLGLFDAELAAYTGPLAVKLKTAGVMLDSGGTKIRNLIDRGELESFLDDGVRKITVASIHRYIAKKIAANETDRAKTAAAVETSLVLARRRRLEKARKIAEARCRSASSNGRGAIDDLDTFIEQGYRRSTSDPGTDEAA
jgi:hypothetical protein